MRDGCHRYNKLRRYSTLLAIPRLRLDMSLASSLSTRLATLHLVSYISRPKPVKLTNIQTVLFPRHLNSESITHIQLFRDYLHYHIKCSKAYMHSWMRKRVTEFQKILNRAKLESEPSADKERKTISYVNLDYVSDSALLTTFP
jgi:hypothetical protein